MRVANELGAGNGEGAKFASAVSVITSTVIGLVFWSLIMIFNDEIALMFSSSEAVLEVVKKLKPLLAFTVLVNSVQPVLSGILCVSQVPLSMMISYFPFAGLAFFLCFFFFFLFLLAGVAVGSGWQAYVAYINLGCYYLVGVPLGYLLGWPFHQGVMVSALSLSLSRSAAPSPSLSLCGTLRTKYIRSCFTLCCIYFVERD